MELEFRFLVPLAIVPLRFQGEGDSRTVFTLLAETWKWFYFHHVAWEESIDLLVTKVKGLLSPFSSLPAAHSMRRDWPGPLGAWALHSVPDVGHGLSQEFLLETQ